MSSSSIGEFYIKKQKCNVVSCQKWAGMSPRCTGGVYILKT